MQISVNLSRLEHHQEYIQSQLKTTEVLLDILRADYRLSADLSSDRAQILNEHIQFVLGMQDQIQKRGQLLIKIHDTLCEAKNIMSSKNSEVGDMLYNIDNAH